MKSLLFVIQNMNMNGANKSLINWLSVLDYTRYDVDLFIYNQQGPLLKEVPEQVTILPENIYMKLSEVSLEEVFEQGNLYAKTVRVLSAVHKKLAHTKRSDFIYLLWRRVPVLEKRYNAAIGWNEGTSHKFVLEKVYAEKRVGWCHIDDNAWPYHTKLQRKVFPQLDFVCTVSKHCKRVLESKYGLSHEKVKVLHNIMPVERILKMSKEHNPFETKKNVVNILTVARMEAIKGVDIAMEAAKRLYDEGYKIHWWILGAEQCENANIKKLKDFFSILPPTSNPYPYIANCDIYVQPSRTGEAWGMAINEARILGKTVIVSDLAAFREQVVDGKTGIIFDNTAEDLFEKITTLIQNGDFERDVSENVRSAQLSNMRDVELLYQIIEGEN